MPAKAPARICAMKSCTPATELLTSAQAPNQMMQQPQIARRVLILRARLALERRVPACSAARTCVSLRSIVEGSIANAVEGSIANAVSSAVPAAAFPSCERACLTPGMILHADTGADAALVR